MQVRPIAELEDGHVAQVRGTVRRARSDSLSSSLGSRECVYWEVREGLDSAPLEHEAQDFWVQDATGRVLVRAPALDVDLRAQRQEDVVTAAASDIQVLSDRIRAIKDQLKAVQGEQARHLHVERKKLAKIATLLCAIKAHARGRKHLGGSLVSQEKWIRRNAALADGQTGAKTVELMVERWEVVIEDGQEVTVEGVFRVEPMPAGIGSGGGYRDRPTCWVARAPSESELYVRGVGASAPQTRAQRAQAQRTEAKRTDAKRNVQRPRRPLDGPEPDPAFERAVLVGLSTLAAVAATLWILLHGG